MSEKIGIVEEIYRPARVNFKRRKVTLKSINDLFALDLIDIQNYSKENNGFRYILVGINGFTKKAYTEPLKNKKGETVTQAFRNMLRRMKYNPIHIWTDLGREFYCKPFKALMDEKNIKLYSTHNEKLKSVFVERLIRTLKTNLFKQFEIQGSYKWVAILPKLVRQYNNKIHSTTKMKPNSVKKSHEKQLLNTVYKTEINTSKHEKFEIGDIVRISKYRSIFSKGYLPNWSTELFKIASRNYTVPESYRIKDMNGEVILGSFQNYELQKTKYEDIYLVEKILQRKNDEVLVKYLGFDTPVWQKKNSILN